MTSLETISSQIEYYDEKTVTTETYLWTDRLDGEYLMMGEPFEKKERSTSVRLPSTPLNIWLLTKSLQKGHSANNYTRVKVIITGKVEDNCNKGLTCCFGETMTIFADRIAIVGEIENYTVPEKFQLPEPN